jgi:hypothetical protein
MTIPLYLHLEVEILILQLFNLLFVVLQVLLHAFLLSLSSFLEPLDLKLHLGLVSIAARELLDQLFVFSHFVLQLCDGLRFELELVFHVLFSLFQHVELFFVPQGCRLAVFFPFSDVIEVLVQDLRILRELLILLLFLHGLLLLISG